MRNKLNQGFGVLKKISFNYAAGIFKIALSNFFIYLIFLTISIILIYRKETTNIQTDLLTDDLLINIIPTVIIIAITILYPIAIYSTAIQYALHKVLSTLINDKEYNYLDKILDIIIKTYKNIQPEFVKDTLDYSKEKIALLNIDKEFSNNKAIHKIAKMIIKRLPLTQFIADNQDLSYSDMIKNSLEGKLLELTTPSYNRLYILAAVQIITVLYLIVI